MNLPEKIRAVVLAYPDWSRHEREHMEAIIDEILDHCRSGTGNGFIRKWCDRYLAHLFADRAEN